MRDSPIEIRELTAVEELKQAVDLQREIWGYDDLELLPLRLFIVATKIGGLVLGAFDGSRMVSFALAIPGLKGGRKFYLHSHMLGVLADYRNTGLGRRMKLRQRDFAIANGVDLIEWTFDPLELKNAFFNIERLGAIARRYVHNQYGTTSSRLHGGLPTDRLVAEWWVQSPRVIAICTGQPLLAQPVKARISVPTTIAADREQDPKRARAIQIEVGEQFERNFQQNLAVIGFERNEGAGTYLIGEWESE